MLPLEEFQIQAALAQVDPEPPVSEEEPEPNPVDNEAHNELGLIAILAEEGIMGDFDVRSRIMSYAKNAQNRIDHSKAIVVEVPKDESTYKIASTLEKLYFEGVDTDLVDGNPLNNNAAVDDNNQLIGVILVGEVPIPVVHDDEGKAIPSLYPYTDFYRKNYIYNHETDLFEKNGAISDPNPEVWHGVIRAPSQDPGEAKQQLIEYFEKNNDYSQGDEDLNNFEKRMLYANFPEMEARMNFTDYQNYQRYLRFMEEMVFKRFNKHLLKEFIAGVSKDLKSDTPVMDDFSISNLMDIHTETIFKKYSTNFAESLRVYRSGLNSAIENTGRWSSNEVDSPESLITLRDEFAKHTLHATQLELENEVDEFIDSAVKEQDRAIDVFTQAQLNVRLKIADINADNRTFTFYSHFDGVQVLDIESAEQCGIQIGTPYDPEVSTLENNSVLVNANRMYNPETLIVPPNNADSDWKLSKQNDYKLHGGCTFNNSIEIEETGASPEKCNFEDAEETLFDHIGQREVEEGEPVYTDLNRCSNDRLSYLLPNDNQFDSVAAGADIVGIVIGDDLERVISDAYVALQGNIPNATRKQKANYVIHRLIETGESFVYEPQALVEIELAVTTDEKQLDSIYRHKQPTNEAIAAIKHIGVPRVDPVTGQLNYPQILTPSLAADGIRLISFIDKLAPKNFEYMNLFRIDGETPTEITNNFFKKINQKQTELNATTGIASGLFESFFDDNSEIREPLIWKGMSIDQKLAEIIPKYVDRDSDMPTPNYNPKRSPQNQPEGYEVLHVVAEGDALGYQFGLNRAMRQQGGLDEEPEELIDAGTGTGGPDLDEDDESSGGGLEGGNYVCGDPSGVEIWEWFDSFQCWIEEEILPAQDLFALSQACSAAPLPAQGTNDQDGDIFDELLVKPATFDVEMKRKSLILGQEATITVSALNSNGEPMLGYIDLPVNLQLENPSLGSFSTNNFNIYAGDKEVTFTANKEGSTELTVSMGEMEPRTFQIDIYDEIKMGWQAEEELVNGRSEFTIGIAAINPDGEKITNISDTVNIAPERPADGGFVQGGNVELLNGQGQTTFLASPGKKEIPLISKDEFITTNPYIIEPSGIAATQLVVRPPAFLPIAEETEVEVIAADDFGVPGTEWDEPIAISLAEGSEEFASLKSSVVQMENGRGTITVVAGKNTADITLVADHNDLRLGQVTIPLLARVDSSQWQEKYPQSLVASFVGFPAGDFTQENYFGGTHLMAGKTQAVYSFMTAPTPEPSITISPNEQITLTNVSQTVLVEFPGNEILLQAFDQMNMQTMFSKKRTLSLDAVELYEGSPPEVGKAYIESLDNDHFVIKQDGGYEVRNPQGDAIVSIQPSKVQLSDPSFKWEYVAEPEFNAIELVLTDGVSIPARLIMNLEPQDQTEDVFDEISPNLKWVKNYGGTSTSDPGGLIFYEANSEVDEEDREQFYGIEGENKYLSLFASGTNFGEATRFNMPDAAILLGDPTVALETRSNSSLNYNSATGQQLYKDAENSQVVSINHFNFNNDGEQDVALLLDDGRVRLLEGGSTEPPYKDRGNIALLADGGVALESLDLEEDGYEDLLVATDEGRLAILHNRAEQITRIDHQLSIGKKLFKLLKGDMDQDGASDLVVLDSRGDLYIFYYDQVKGSFPENGKLIGNYGVSINLEANLQKDLDIRYAGIPEPAGPGDGLAPATPSLDDFNLDEVQIDEDAALAFVEGLAEAQEAAAEDPSAALGEEVPKLPWPEGDEIQTYFAPIEEVNGITVNKSVINKDRPEATSIDLEEMLTYRIEIQSSGSFNNAVIADTVPDMLGFDTNSVSCLQGGCQGVEAQQNSIRVFFSGLNLSPGQTTVITYDASVANTPAADLLIQTVDEPNENLPNPNSIIDPYLDILVSPPYNNTGKVLIHYTTAPREYEITQSNEPEPIDDGGGFGGLLEQMQALDGQEFDEDNPAPPIVAEGLGDALDEATGNNDCLADPNNTAIDCAEQALDKVADAISNFACMGGGCFPMPFNRAFLVPPQMPLPMLAFPATLATPVGPMPSPASMFFPLPGMANIPGPIFSAIRFYVAPTLTGGMGLALCWGPYPQSPTVPPPVFPIPYPPPVGNCMVTAIPADVLYGGLCSEIEKGVTKALDFISAGVEKINSGLESVNNNPNIPVNFDQGPQDAGAGGLEIGLAVNLGNSLKFEPPAKAFSNIHIPSFDSITGVVSSWVDRQLLEIQQKLLTLPTFSVYWPDFKSMFALDFSRTEKRFKAWKNTLDGSGAATLDTLADIKKNDADQDAVEAEANKDLNWLQKTKSGLADARTGKVLQSTQAIETQSSIYNLNALEGLYDVASTLPLVNLTEKNVQFNVPWLSTAEIQNFIMELQNWIIYYEQEYDRVKDKWEELRCDDQPDLAGSGSPGGQLSKNAASCTGRQIADAFGASFDDLINSAKQNVIVMQEWLNFPKTLVSYKSQLAAYVGSVACYLDVIAQMMGGYMAEVQQQIVSWAEVIFTIIEIVKNIKELFDIFTNFDTNCDTCTNERFANFGWWSLLGLVIPDLPIIQFPKIPDIVVDFSNIDVLLDIEIPILEVRPEPLPLPPLPYISLPDLPTVNILLQLPPLPVIPGPPDLPQLPDLPPLPTIDLPTLPPPPKLPDLGKAFEVIIPLIEKILQIWCLMKKSFAPVPEQMLNDQITLLTNRPAYLTPLDIIKIQLPNIAIFDLGFNEVRIETVVYLGLRLNLIARPLEEASKTWNEWIKSIPDAMNEAYQIYLENTEELIQEKLDIADQFLEDAAQNFEQLVDENIQGALDNLGEDINDLQNKWQEAIDKWEEDQQAAFDEWAAESSIIWQYEDYANAVQGGYDKLRNLKDSAVNEYFTSLRNLFPGYEWVFLGPLFEWITDDNIEFVMSKLNEADDFGPTQLDRLGKCLKHYDHCRENEDLYFLENGQAVLPKELTPNEPVQVAYTPPSYPQMDEQAVTRQIFESDQGKQIFSLFGDIADVIEEVNNEEFVDYTVLKERFGVQDYLLRPPTGGTEIERLRRMQQELTVHSHELYAEAQGLRNVRDLTAIAGVAPNLESPVVLANTEQAVENPQVGTTTFANTKTNVVVDTQKQIDKQVEQLQESLERETRSHEGIDHAPALGTACTADLCLPDPITGGDIPVIPTIDLIASSETLFMPNGHIVYSDGTGVYLKRDLTIDQSDENTDTGNPQRFKLSTLMNRMFVEERPKGSVNMLAATFTEDSAATFNWHPNTDERLYGYGIELERVVSAYDSGKQDNGLPDTKIILLPPSEDGVEPEAFVGETAISYGTLVTSLSDPDEAVERFGIPAQNIVTDATEVYFPSINNAKINVGELRAVYFDQLNGDAYSMEMENGYYHLKMTWFDENARTATYNQSELIAPQIYAEAAEPIDVAQQEIYYMPIYKEKQINAGEFFADLSGAHEFYWFIDPENNQLTPQIGNQLTIPPQDAVKSFDVKLVASQKLNDPSFETYEKTFTVEVYAPEINLDQSSLNDGIIAGDMTPIPEAEGDDLSGIPFGVYRKRGGVWKNIGILHAENGNKETTNPPLNDHEGKKFIFEDSYYGVGETGAYSIEGFDETIPSPVILKDHEADLKAQVTPGDGLIELEDENFDIKAVPGGTDTPTHIAIIVKDTEEILGNVYYISDNSEKIIIADGALNPNNVAEKGTTVGDANSGDVIVTNHIPDIGPSFPGGVAIFNEAKQTNVALVDKDGTIRMMDSTYSLTLKNKDTQDGRYIFQIVDNAENPVFDIFIQANWDKVEIDTTTQMDTLQKQIGFNPLGETAYAQATPEVTEDVQSESENPFPDVDQSHPFFSQILQLYEARVVGGYEDGTFKPDQKLTRAEFVKIALGVTNCFDCENPTDPQRARYNTDPFPDVSLPAWYFFCISIAKELGMITGYKGGENAGLFVPDDNISRAEAAAVLLRQSEIDLTPMPDGQYVDVPEFAWYKDYVHTAVLIGLVPETLGFVNPDEEITRGEFAFMAAGLQDFRQCRLVDEDGDGYPDWWEMEHNLDPLVPDAEEACPCINNPNQNDTDGDGRRDVCDIDIDNDSVLNPICIFDEEGNFSKSLLDLGALTLGEAVDNCVFTPNTDQVDLDGNGIGDACELCACSDNPNQNDTDGDGIRDVCDSDIDNDTVPHPICIFDDNGLLDESKVPADADNCIFTQNPFQEDADQDGKGDVCDEVADLCPEVPEDLDGVDDQDGCPEVDDTFDEKDPGTYVGPGPLCGFIDYASDIIPQDSFMTAITDLETHDTVFSKSKELTKQ